MLCSYTRVLSFFIFLSCRTGLSFPSLAAGRLFLSFSFCPDRNLSLFLLNSLALGSFPLSVSAAVSLLSLLDFLVHFVVT